MIVMRTLKFFVKTILTEKLWFVKPEISLSVYKCGICDIVKNCLANVCLNLLCVNNNVNNSTIPQVVTYEPQAPPLSVEENLNVPNIQPQKVKLRFSGVKRS